MNEKTPDELIITALLERFTQHRLPRALTIEKNVMKGEVLSANDLAFLEMVLSDAKYILKLSDKYPQHQEMVAKAIQMYADITQKALENEKNLKS